MAAHGGSQQKAVAMRHGTAVLAVIALLALGGCGIGQKGTVGAIEALGGTVTIDPARPDKPVVGVDLHGANVDDDWLSRHLRDLPELRELDLAATKVTDEGLVHVGRLSELRGLNLSSTWVGDAGVQSLTQLRELRDLGLGGCRITDAGLRHLQALPKLERVNVHGARITPVGLQQLQKERPKLNVQS
jgi:hypothetical protein